MYFFEKLPIKQQRNIDSAWIWVQTTETFTNDLYKENQHNWNPKITFIFFKMTQIDKNKNNLSLGVVHNWCHTLSMRRCKLESIILI